MGQQLACGAQRAGREQAAAAPPKDQLRTSRPEPAPAAAAAEAGGRARAREAQAQERGRHLRALARARRALARLEKDQRKAIRDEEARARTEERKVVAAVCGVLVLVLALASGKTVASEWAATGAALGLFWLLLKAQSPTRDIELPARPEILLHAASKRHSPAQVQAQAEPAPPEDSDRSLPTSDIGPDSDASGGAPRQQSPPRHEEFASTEDAPMATPAEPGEPAAEAKAVPQDTKEPPRSGLASTLADEGNGYDAPLNEANMKAIADLYEKVHAEFDALVDQVPADASFATYETCRRYLVAREWNAKAAEKQLRGTIKWRMETEYGAGDFFESSAARRNPWGWSMRPVGFSSPLGCPVAYTVFSHANERHNLEGSMDHLTRLLDAMRRVIHERASEGLVPTARQRQWVWVIDFHGFSLRDSNPRTGIHTADLLSHYPEFLNCIVLLNAPALFSGLYKVMYRLVDDRVRSKVVFVSRAEASEKLCERFGPDIANWVQAESEQNKAMAHLGRSGTPKKYWVPPEDPNEHDPRGTHDYVHGKWYLKTPGEQYDEDQAE